MRKSEPILLPLECPAGRVLAVRASLLPDLISQGKEHTLLAELPSFYTRVAAPLWKQLVEGWDRAQTRFRQQKSINSLLFCHPDGSKSLLLKSTKDVLVVLFRSKTTDFRYLKFLSDYFGFDYKCAVDEFERLAPFEQGVLSQVSDCLAQSDLGFDKDSPALHEASLIADAYAVSNNDKIDRFRFDMRMFNTMRALRRLMVETHVNLLTMDLTGSRPGLTEFFVYHTADVVPGRPPVYAAFLEGTTLEKLRESVGTVVSPNSTVDLIEDSRISKLLGIPQITGFPSDFRKYSAAFTVELPNLVAVLDIAGPRLSKLHATQIRDCVMAGLDCTNNVAMNTLKHRALISTKDNLVALQQLFDIYAAGLLGARGDSIEKDEQWSQALKTAKDCVVGLGAASRRPKTSASLTALFDSFVDKEADRKSFDPQVVHSRIENLKRQVVMERLGIG